ncbi:MAG: hemolysin family protein [Gemmataceae bacterium]
MIDPLWATAAATTVEESNLSRLILGLITIPILVAFNAFFVAAEFALVAVRRTRVEELVNQNVPRSTHLLAALNDLNDVVAAAQLGITVASLALGLVSEPALATLLAPLFGHLPPAWQGPVTHTLSVIIALAMMTFLHVVFGEQMPKIAALQAAEKVGLWVAVPMLTFTRIFRPVVRLLNGTSSYFLKKLGYHPESAEGEVHTVDELRLLVEDTEEAGLMTAEQADVVLNVFALSDKKVRDCMVPWVKVAALDLATPPERVLEFVRQGAHTRIPVYDGTPEAVIGVVNTKDLFYLFSLSGVVTLIDAIYEPLYLQADSAVSVALNDFRKAHRHLAVVRDGETIVGILTLEDVLEEIVGEIEDEHDVEAPKLRKADYYRMLQKRRRPGGAAGPGGH